MPEWNLVFRTQQKHFDLSASGFDRLEPKEKAEITKSIHGCAQAQFGYMYKNYPVYDLVQSGNCSDLMKDFLEFLNSKPLLDTIRRISGFQDIDYADAQATRYDPGHFLTSHDDTVAGKNRLAAYVFNLTPNWHPDWGGNLMFYDNQKTVIDTFVPQFNSLSLFAIGTQHGVSMVTPYASSSRFAITGWFRYR